jgi:hypothetical protein
LNFLFADRRLRERMRLLPINDTRVEVRAKEMTLFITFEPCLRRIAYMHAIMLLACQ